MEALDLLMLAPPLYSVFHQRSSAFISHPCGQTTEHTEHTERTGGWTLPRTLDAELRTL